jgi:hypothetical protein
MHYCESRMLTWNLASEWVRTLQLVHKSSPANGIDHFVCSLPALQKGLNSLDDDLGSEKNNQI